MAKKNQEEEIERPKKDVTIHEKNPKFKEILSDFLKRNPGKPSK